jgi:SAM-dependent methyltransferase
MQPFYSISDVPTNSCILLSSAEEALGYPRGDVVLGLCNSCGFICNQAFVQALTEYSGRYEETQGFSGTFNKYHQELAEDLIKRYQLNNKSVLEIGCGKGEFLELLCRIGGNKGLGFDPGYDYARGVLDDVAEAKVIKDFYSEKYNEHQADFVACKMTLEHIPDTSRFVGLARNALNSKESATFYLQVPESMRIFQQCAFEDIYYEHCNYFTPGSLARLFRSLGMNIKNLYTSYEGQYLAIEAFHAGDERQAPLVIEQDLDAIRETVTSFPTRNDAKVSEWNHQLQRLAKLGPVTLWGSGSKAVSFLSMVDHQGCIDRVVDINPYRQGHYMVGTAQPIIAPAALKENPPVAVIVMNPVYKDEICQQLKELDLYPEVLTL